MDQINHIIHTLYIGGTPVTCRDPRRDGELLRGPGAEREGLPKIDLIIDCRSPEEVAHNKAWAAFAGLPPVVRIGMHDDSCRANDPAMFRAAGEAVAKRAAELGKSPTDLVVFVHCHMGINRAPSTAMYLLMEFHGMTPRQAFRTIREKRVGARIHYASLAIAAHLGESPRASAVLEKWQAFEDRYWTPARRQRINDIIQKNHRRRVTRLVQDDAGFLHGVGV